MLLALLLMLSVHPQQQFIGLQGTVHLVRGVHPFFRRTTYPDLSSALAAALDGDLLILDPGLYRGPRNRDLVVTQDLVIRGRHGSRGSVIDCEGAGRAFDFQVGQAVLGGVTIRGGNATDGGGVLVSRGTVVFDDVNFEDGMAEFGGGLFGSSTSDVLLFECRLLGNTASGSGGGAYVAGKGQFTSCLFGENDAAVFGGGLDVCSVPPQPVSVLQCTFQQNSAGQGGGGVSVFFSGNLTLDRCTVIGNEAGTDGGGLLVSFSPFVIGFVSNSWIVSNTSRTGGGGIHGGKIGISNCTVVGNETSSSLAGGILAGSLAVLLNCIVRDNVSNASTPLDQQVQGATGPLSTGNLALFYSNIEGISGSPTNFAADPQFLDPSNGDYHIASTSPCVDAGLAFSLTYLQLDIDNEPRFQGPSVDIGADEVPVP